MFTHSHEYEHRNMAKCGLYEDVLNKFINRHNYECGVSLICSCHITEGIRIKVIFWKIVKLKKMTGNHSLGKFSV